MQTLSPHYADRSHVQIARHARQRLCYFHQGPQKSGRHAFKPVETKLELEPISDPAAISLNADRILRALASNQISPGKAAILFQGLQTVLASFRMPPFESRDFPPANEPGESPQRST